LGPAAVFIIIPHARNPRDGEERRRWGWWGGIEEEREIEGWWG